MDALRTFSVSARDHTGSMPPLRARYANRTCRVGRCFESTYENEPSAFV